MAVKNSHHGVVQGETFEIDGILFDYYDFTLAKMAVSEAILKYELHDKAIQANPKYNGYLHTLERKLEHILENMECPNDELPRPSGYGIMGK